MSKSEHALENQQEQREAKLAQCQTGQLSDNGNQDPPVNRTGPWTVQEYADYWQVHRLTVNNWLKRGELGSIKCGGTRRVLPQHHQDFCKRHEAEAFA